MVLKSVFPKAKMVGDLNNIYENHEKYIKDAVNKASQNSIKVNVEATMVSFIADLIQVFNGKKINKYHYKWKVELNENRIVIFDTYDLNAYHSSSESEPIDLTLYIVMDLANDFFAHLLNS